MSQKLKEITKEAYLEWRELPVTEAFFDELEVRITVIKQDLLNLQEDSVENMGSAYLKYRTRLAALEDIVQMEYEEVIPEEDLEEAENDGY